MITLTAEECLQLVALFDCGQSLANWTSQCQGKPSLLDLQNNEQRSKAWSKAHFSAVEVLNKLRDADPNFARPFWECERGGRLRLTSS